MPQKTDFTAPSLEETRHLYESAARLKELAPWTWMDETEIFGVQHPETGELGFVSVMGMAGEHFAVAIYQGAEGLYGLQDFAADAEMANPQQLLDIPQLQASFEDRDMLDKPDREVIKQLGLKFRGAHAWPMFRSYRPGFMPWFVTAQEARLITYALTQMLEVAPRVKDNPAILSAEDNEAGEIYLVRVARREGDGLVWEDRMMRVPPPEPVRLPVVVDVEVVGQLKELPRRSLALEIDLLSVPAAIGEKGERPARPYLLMLADAQSGMIVGTEMMTVEDSLRGMHEQIPMLLAALLAQAGIVPGEIRVRSELLAELLHPLAKILNIKIREADRLPGIDAVMDSMFSWMMDGEL
ncbi:MAG: DUF7309 domain-containing protein [Pyrinomonadaceae bacterium]